MGAEPDKGRIVAPHASDTAPPPLSETTINDIPPILPHGRVFPIQIGDELFKLSGASICSDAPSYFSQYFKCQIETAKERGEDPNSAVKTLYIDRDPQTFRDISMHLQGYHIKPRDATHFVRLFADAQFYSLPKFISQLYEENIFVTVGGREFAVPRDVFNDPGNSPNYFSLGFAIFFSRPDDLFPGLSREGLIRPPSIVPPSVPHRDPNTFADLLCMLRGYPLRIRDEQHRVDLLRDARYFHFKGLEQKIIAHEISYNISRGREEIALRLENLQKSGVNVDPRRTDDDALAGWVTYARPFVDDRPRELILEIGGNATKMHFSDGVAKAEFYGDTKARVTRLFEVIAAKLNLAPPSQKPVSGTSPGNTGLSEDHVRVIFESESAVVLDGEPRTDLGLTTAEFTQQPESQPENGNDSPSNPRKRRRTNGTDAYGLSNADEWMVSKAQWRLKLRSASGGRSMMECVLVAVKVDAVSSEQARNAARGFL